MSINFAFFCINMQKKRFWHAIFETVLCFWHAIFCFHLVIVHKRIAGQGFSIIIHENKFDEIYKMSNNPF